MKKLINFTGQASPHLSRKLIYLMLLLITLMGGTGSAWADTTLFTTNFSTADGWSASTDMSGSGSIVINGTTISYKAGGRVVATSESGTLTFGSTNLGSTTNASSQNNFIAIPLTGVNGSITITYTGDKKSCYYTCDDGNIGTLNARTTAGNNNERTWTISDLTNSNVTLYLGTSGQNLTSLTITTPSGGSPSPVDPTVTFSNGAYTIGGSALDLSTLFTSNSSGAVTYTVTNANGTGATVAGTNFTATTAGTATVTASQAATSGYNAKVVNATITVNAAAPVGNDFVMTYPSSKPSNLAGINPTGGTLSDAGSSPVSFDNNGIKLGSNNCKLKVSLTGKTIVEGTTITVKYKSCYSDQGKISGIAILNSSDKNKIVLGSVAVDASGSYYHTFTAEEAANYTNEFLIDRNSTGYSVYITGITVSGAGQAYSITKGVHDNGDFSVSASAASSGTVIKLNATPAAGYALTSWDVYKTGESSTKVTVTNNQFTMPAYDVTVDATFTLVPERDLVKWDKTYSEQGLAGFTDAPVVPDAAGTKLTFQPNVRYSKLLIDSRLYDFKEQENLLGFDKYNTSGTEIGTTDRSARNNLHYVPGLVGKAVLEAVDYYRTSDFIDVKPWYYSVKDYANTDISSNGKSGKSLDDLNAVKMYSLLRQFAKNNTFGDNASTTTINTRFNDALSAIGTYNRTYVIGDECSDAKGGWFHKSTYDYEMWCDGQYMGPALLAQIINDAPYYSQVAASGTDWDLITKQFTIAYNHLWDTQEKLLYHGFSAVPTGNDANWATRTISTTNHSLQNDNTCKTNTAFWGRANGWYFLALVDVMQQMERAGQGGSANFNTLKTILNTVAEGIAARQDDATGCWYQLVGQDGSFKSSTKNNSNYIESSASAIFLDAFMKGKRLGYFTNDYTALIKKGYKGYVENFLVSDGDGGVQIIKTSLSAGLDGSRKGDNDYYLESDDAGKITDVTGSYQYTEGKALGAFIMAAVEYERLYLEEPAASDDATLSGITLGDGENLSPAFDSAKHLYTVNAVLTESSTITPICNDANANAVVNKDVAKGTATITVTSQDESSRVIYDLVYNAPADYSQTFTYTATDKDPATKGDTSVKIGNVNYNTVSIGSNKVDSRVVLYGDWIWRSGNNIQNFNSGTRGLGVLNCKKNQIVTINITRDGYDLVTTATNAEFVSNDGDQYKYRVLADGNVGLDIARNAHVSSVSISAAPKVAFTATAGTNGSIAITADGVAITSGAEVEIGAKVVVTATPASGYETVWTKTAGNGGEEGVNTYTINSITEATTIEASFNAISAGETKDIYTYNVGALTTSDDNASGTIGGTISCSKAGGDASGYKLDGAGKYIKVTLASPNTLQAGDKIIVKANSTSSGGGVYLSTVSTGAKVGTDDANAVVGGTLSAKNTVEDLEYVVTASDLLKGNSTLYIYYNSVSTYVKAVTIQRTTGGGSKAESPLAIKAGSAYATAGNGWTPVVGGTIALTDIISSQSTGAYSITSGDAATLADGVLTAVKNGTITLSQAADETFKAGTKDINVRIAADNTAAESTNYTVATDDVISDGMQVIRKNITMTYGNDNFWSKGSGSDGHGNITGGQKNPSVTNNIPLSGTFYKFEPTKNGTLSIDTKIGAGKPIYVSEDGTLIAATANEKTVGNGETLDANYSGNLVFDVKAGKTYYYYLMGSKAGLYGFSFADAVTITTQPVQPEAYIQNTAATALSVAATASTAGGALSYQWYSCDADGTNAKAVGGNASFTPSTTAVGTTYYYCVVTEADAKTATSDIVSVAVSKAFTAPIFDPVNDATIVIGTPINVTWENGMTLYARWSGSANQTWTVADFTEQHKVGSTGAGRLSRSQTGNQYVYCVLVDEATGASSDVIKTHYVIEKQSPIVVTEPAESSTVLRNESVTLSVVGGNGADSYQWVVCDDASRTNARNISGATLSTYTPPTNELGTKYYYCMVMNSKFEDDEQGTRNFAPTRVASVTVTNKVGADNYSTDFLGDIKGDKILYPGQSVNYKFVNTNGLSDDKFKNFVIAIKGANIKTNQVNLYANGMAHFYDTAHRHIQDGFSINPSDAISSADFNTEMNGASVDVTVAYSPEKDVTMTANIITSTGKVWTYTFNSQAGGFTYTADAITAALSVDHAQLTMQDNASDLNVQANATVLQNHQVVVPYTTSSNGDVVVTNNGETAGRISSVTVDKGEKTITINAGNTTGLVGFKIWQKEGSKTTAILDESGNVTGDTETQTYLAGVKEFAVTIATDEGASDVSLATLAVNGQSIEIVADQTEYTAKSPSKVVPTVTATATNPSATVTVTQATAVDGTATIRVATDTTQKDYTVKFTPSAETPNGTVHWALSGFAQVNNKYEEVPEYASDADGNIYQMIHKGANGDYYGSFLYLGGETSNVNREISFKGISGKGRIIINTRKSSDSKVGNTIVIKDAAGNAVATGTYTNETACATTIFTYDANQTYTANINGRAYILSMDYVPCREDILYVEENGQRYNLTKENEANDDYYIGKNESWSEIKIDGTKYNLFNLSGSKRSFTLNVNGAMAFEILTQNNSSSNRTYKVSVNGKEVTGSPFTANKTSLTSTGLIMTGNTGDITITVSDGNGSVYPYQIIFYDKEPEASLSSNSALVKVGKTLQVPLSTMSGGAITLTNDGTDKTKATASFNADSKVLTLNGLAEGTSVLTFNVEGGNGYVASTVEFTVNVEKQVLTLSYSPASYSYNVDTEEESGNLTPTLIVKDEDDNDVSLSGLNITYTSDDESIATVTSDGTITKRATGQGSADIVATLVEDATYKTSYGVFSVLIEQGRSLKITDETKYAGDADNPAVGETLTLTAADETTPLVYATFGGWKWGISGNDHKYVVNGSTKSDAWAAPVKYTGSGGTRPTYVDGYSFASSGKTDAMDETKSASDGTIFGQVRNGWFKSESDDAHIKPFSLPVRGAYMTFEPQRNGMLSVYILQNGAFNSTTQADGTSKIRPGEFQPHSFHVVDHSGTPVPLYTDFEFVVKEPVTQKVNGNPVVCNYTGQSEPGEFDECDVATWPMFYTNYTAEERLAIKNAWNTGKNGAQQVVKLHDESFFIIQKAYVKYTFYVAASQTYYMFSNFSKIGFAGMNFVQDAEQPDQVEDVLALSDVADFPTLKNASENVSSKLSVPQYGKITVNRKFTANQWNTICLPFDMTEREVRENFGDDVQLIIYDGYEENEGMSEGTFHFVYHEIQSILAGYPYLIKTSKNVDGITVKNKLIQPKNTGTPSEPNLDYTSPKPLVTFGTSRYYCGTPYVTEAAQNPYTFTGTDNYSTAAKTRVYNGSAYVGSGQIKRLSAAAGSSTLNGYRAYIKITEPNPAKAEALRARTLSVSFRGLPGDGNLDTPTCIDEILEAIGLDSSNTNSQVQKGIFNLNGQKMGDDIKSLPAGLYIINGKKVYIK